MRKLAQFATITTLIALGGLTSSDARAGATAAGAICEYVSGDGIQYGSTAVQVSGVSTVACAIPMDHQLGTTVHFRVVMDDNISNGIVKCNGYAYSENGSQLNTVSPDITSSDCDNVSPPCQDIDEDTITVNPQAATNVYVVRCETTATTTSFYSAIESVRAY